MEGNRVKPSILPGFMELLPADQMVFNRMLDTIRNTYEKFGFVPLDTPTIEKSEILLSKSGGETEKQIYRFSKGDSDVALRFDLTVPLARYVAQHFHELTFPFRRYHIGKAFRGEKPQRGRFREFYQCDIDIVGNGELSLVSDAEVLSVIYNTFKALGFDDFTIRINNRKLLWGFIEQLGIGNKTEVLRAIDKLEKIGKEGLIKELDGIGVKAEAVDKLLEFLAIEGSTGEMLERLKGLEKGNELYLTGAGELEQVCSFVRDFGVPEKNYRIDLTIARGLDYYTGTVYETLLDNYRSIGSVCSGGRYDNLASHFIDRKLPGVGVSVGLTRLFYQLREAGMLPQAGRSTPALVLVVPMEGAERHAIELAVRIREAGIAAEVYLEKGKIGKKLSYADKLGIPLAVIIGEDEIKSGLYTVKVMADGTQHTADREGIVDKIRSLTQV